MAQTAICRQGRTPPAIGAAWRACSVVVRKSCRRSSVTTCIIVVGCGIMIAACCVSPEFQDACHSMRLGRHERSGS